MGFALAAGASGDVVTSVDLVDPSDGLEMPPAGVVCVDVMVDLTTPGDEWTAGAMITTTSNGATFRYRQGVNGLPNLRNPNAGNPAGNRTIFATSIGHPVERSDTVGRFSLADVGIAGGYSPPYPTPPPTPTSLDVAWFRTPEGRVDIDGAVARVAINLPAGVTDDQLLLTPGTVTPPASHPVVLVSSIGDPEPGGHDPGTANASVMFPEISGIDWVLSAVPEPGAITMMLVAAAWVVRRR
jgi:hypothetical protein